MCNKTAIYSKVFLTGASLWACDEANERRTQPPREYHSKPFGGLVCDLVCLGKSQTRARVAA